MKGDNELALRVHVSGGGTTQETLNALCWRGGTDCRKATFNDINIIIYNTIYNNHKSLAALSHLLKYSEIYSKSNFSVGKGNPRTALLIFSHFKLVTVISLDTTSRHTKLLYY